MVKLTQKKKNLVSTIILVIEGPTSTLSGTQICYSFLFNYFEAYSLNLSFQELFFSSISQQWLSLFSFFFSSTNYTSLVLAFTCRTLLFGYLTIVNICYSYML